MFSSKVENTEYKVPTDLVYNEKYALYIAIKHNCCPERLSETKHKYISASVADYKLLKKIVFLTDYVKLKLN